MALRCRNGDVYDCRQGLILVFYRDSGLLSFGTSEGVSRGGNGLTLDGGGDDKFELGYASLGPSEQPYYHFAMAAVFLQRLLDLGPQESYEELGNRVIFRFAPKPVV